MVCTHWKKKPRDAFDVAEVPENAAAIVFVIVSYRHYFSVKPHIIVVEMAKILIGLIMATRRDLTTHKFTTALKTVIRGSK